MGKGGIIYMKFGEALEQVRKGKGMRLPHWQEGVFVIAIFPEEGYKIMRPALVKFPSFHFWSEEVYELLDENWEVVDWRKSMNI